MKRWFACGLLLLLTQSLVAQTPDKPAMTKYIASLYDPATGGYRVDAKSPPSLRATSGAVRSYGYLGETLPHAEKNAAFLLSCYDRDSGAFVEPGGKADVTITSIGVLGAVELKISPEKFPKTMEFLRANVKTFEDARIGAAALDSLKQKPDWLDAWIKLADGQLNNDGSAGKLDGRARETASVAAMKLRLGYPMANKPKVVEAIRSGQRGDGGWGKLGESESDFETTYRVMRALSLLKEKPEHPAKLREWIAKCRNADGGYGVKPGQPSTLSGTYYTIIVTKWLDALTK